MPQPPHYQDQRHALDMHLIFNLVFVYFVVVLSLSCLEFKTLNSNPRCFNSLPARSDVQMGQPAQAWPPIKWGVRTSCLQQVLAFMLLIVTSCLSSLVDVSEFFFKFVFAFFSEGQTILLQAFGLTHGTSLLAVVFLRWQCVLARAA